MVLVKLFTKTDSPRGGFALWLPQFLKSLWVPSRISHHQTERPRKTPFTSCIHLALLDALGSCCSSLSPHLAPGACAELDEAVRLIAPQTNSVVSHESESRVPPESRMVIRSLLGVEWR